MSMFFHLYVILLESRRDLETLPRRFSPIYFSIRQRYDPLKNPRPPMAGSPKLVSSLPAPLRANVGK